MPSTLIVITPQQFKRLWKLQDACSRIDSFDEELWVRGATAILSNHQLQEGKTYEVRVQWYECDHRNAKIPHVCRDGVWCCGECGIPVKGPGSAAPIEYPIQLV